jgi:hypothetical protein
MVMKCRAFHRNEASFYHDNDQRVFGKRIKKQQRVDGTRNLMRCEYCRRLNLEDENDVSNMLEERL